MSGYDFSRVREKDLAKLNLLRFTVSVHSVGKIFRYCNLIRMFHFVL